MSERVGFTSGKPQIVTEKDLSTRWSGFENAASFECEVCGYKFALGDTYRWVYANGSTPSAGNFMVCAKCDCSDTELIALRQQAIKLCDVFHEHHELMGVATLAAKAQTELLAQSAELADKDAEIASLKAGWDNATYISVGFELSSTRLYEQLAASEERVRGLMEAENAASERERMLHVLKQRLQRGLLDLHYVAQSDMSWHPHGYSVLWIPDWEAKQLLAQVDAALLAPVPTSGEKPE